MAKYGKWIGAGLGLALGGPLGALFGLFIGSMFDNIQTIAIPSDGGPIQSDRVGDRSDESRRPDHAFRTRLCQNISHPEFRHRSHT